jgi:phage tail-like protein
MARSAAVDPLEKFRFQVSWSSSGDSEGTALVRLGFHDFQSPKKTVTKGTYREGIDPDIHQLFAGLASMEDVTFSRGIIALDPNDEFYKWMSAVQNNTAGTVGRTSLTGRPPLSGSNDYRKDVTLKVLDREGTTVRQWTLFNSFPVAFHTGSDWNAGEDGDKSLESLTLGYEDFKEEVPDTQTPVPVSSSL